MKPIAILFSFVMLTACNTQADKTQQLQARINSLQSKLDKCYTPGLGEFMTSIQMHHAKLWFAGINNNWKLADFEIKEIQEALDNIREFNADRPEVKSINMITPAIDSVNYAIKQQSTLLFKSSFTLLTNTCNNCHRATAHEFNEITIPSAPPVSNQNFSSVQ